MCSLVEILCVLKEKIELICWKFLLDLHATDILGFNFSVNFVYFLSKWINCELFLTELDRKEHLKEIQLFGWSNYELNVSVQGSENFYFTFSVTNMAEIQKKGALQLIILYISNNF